MTPPLRSSTPTLDIGGAGTTTTTGRSSATSASATSASATLRCCCGRALCPALRRSSVIVESVEKDAHTAAQLGKALLARHEAFKADVERDRLELTCRINRLEMENRSLEAANALKIEENRALLDQLEALNSTVSDADSRIRLLEANLLSSNQSVRRLESSAARAADAERHLSLLEHEQDRLLEELRSAKEDGRSYILRYKEAQRAMTDMQDQLDRLEQEANLERDRHADVVKRMERQRDVEKQLDAAAGRLKGAAATRSLQGNEKNNRIVGHFVRDLLEDNANLQLGVTELKELLDRSNDEVQCLREQVMCQQPADDNRMTSPAASTTLKAELDGKMEDALNYSSPSLSQQVHIHHHYHAGPPSKHGKRSKRTKASLLPYSVSSPHHASMSAPGSPPMSMSKWSGRFPSSPAASALLSSDASETEMTPTSSKPAAAWSALSNLQSDYSSSIPSSPLVNQSQLFDRGYSDLHTSLGSPVTSLDPLSPPLPAHHAKQFSIGSSHSFQSLRCLDSEPDLPPLPREPIVEEEDEATRLDSSCDGPCAEMASADKTYDGQDADDDVVVVVDNKDMFGRGSLRRVASHESIMSLSGGLDIHTLQARPSQMTLRPLGGAHAVVTGVVAQPTLSRSLNKRSDAALRDNFAGFKTPRGGSSPMMASQSKLRGWTAWRPWGGGSNGSESGSSSPAAGRFSSTAATTDVAVTPDNNNKGKEKDTSRSPGINQPGSIPGFQEYWASNKRKGAPAQVNAQVIDREALSDGLLG